MSKVDFKNMADVDLVAYAREQGHNVRGLNRDRIMDLLTEKPPESIALPDDEATLCAKRSCPNRIPVKVVGSVQTILAPKEPSTVGRTISETNEVLEDMPRRSLDSDCFKSWKEVRAKAKELGIKTYGKKREQVETEIKEKQNG